MGGKEGEGKGRGQGKGEGEKEGGREGKGREGEGKDPTAFWEKSNPEYKTSVKSDETGTVYQNIQKCLNAQERRTLLQKKAFSPFFDLEGLIALLWVSQG